MIVAGIGCRAEVRAESLESALSLAAEGRAPDRIATVDARAGLLVLRDFADRLGVELIPVARRDLAAQTTLTRSEASLKAHGIGSVAEAAALAAAGPGARLFGPRVVSADRLATCALAVVGESE